MHHCAPAPWAVTATTLQREQQVRCCHPQHVWATAALPRWLRLLLQRRRLASMEINPECCCDASDEH